MVFFLPAPGYRRARSRWALFITTTQALDREKPQYTVEITIKAATVTGVRLSQKPFEPGAVRANPKDGLEYVLIIAGAEGLQTYGPPSLMRTVPGSIISGSCAATTGAVSSGVAVDSAETDSCAIGGLTSPSRDAMNRLTFSFKALVGNLDCLETGQSSQ